MLVLSFPFHVAAEGIGQFHRYRFAGGGRYRMDLELRTGEPLVRIDEEYDGAGSIVFDFGKDKVDAAATLYPRTLDHDDFYKVLKELEFESDRDALRNRIREIDHSGLPAGF